MRNSNLYFDVCLQYDNNQATIDKLIDFVGEFNDYEGTLAYDGIDSQGVMHFIYQPQRCDDEAEAVDRLSDLKELLNTDFVCSSITVQNVGRDRKTKLHLAEEARRAWRHRDIEARTRWNVRSREKVLQDCERMSDSKDFCNFVHKLDQYIKNIKAIEGNGKYDILFVTEQEDVNRTEIINTIYDLYCAYDLIMNFEILSGNRTDIIGMKDGVNQLLVIDDDWNVEGRQMFSGVKKMDLITNYRQQPGILLSFMSKERYEKIKDEEGLQRMFTHQVVLPALSQKDKFNILAEEAKGYGLSLSEEILHDSTLVQPLATLRQLLGQNATRALYNENYTTVLDATCFQKKETLIDEQQSEPWKELEAMIGLENVKNLIKEISSFLSKRGRDAVPSLHMVFRGNPGTGKTTVARIIGRIFADLGILKKDGRFIEADRKNLIAMFVGHTAPKVASLVNQALGGVLFIDEAYSLNPQGRDIFAQEALATLVKQMEDHRHDFVCIMAGYTKEMDEMLDSNPGMRERVQFYLDFPDYDAEEMLKIFQTYCDSGKYVLRHDAAQILLEYFYTMTQHKDKNFANARLVRKIFDRVRMKQALRSDGDDIEVADVEAVFAEQQAKYVVQRAIGFEV